MFGQPSRFAIEVGAIDRDFNAGEPYLAFRFWLAGVPLGDWDDRISLKASVAWARLFLSHSADRKNRRHREMTGQEAYLEVYRRHFDWDYTVEPQALPNLRDLFHLDSIGMGAVEDKFAVFAVVMQGDIERMIAVDLRTDDVQAEVRIPFGECDDVLSKFIEWGDSVIGQSQW
jgi:hypothetical protein